MSHVFISYSTKNAEYAYKLAHKLRNAGFDIWIDNDELRASDNWWESILKALRAADAFIVIMTPQARQSIWVQKEVFLALKWEKPIFPLHLEGNPDDWEIFVLTQFRSVQEGKLPPSRFYNDLERYSKRKSHEGLDITDIPIPIDNQDKELILEITKLPFTDDELYVAVSEQDTKVKNKPASEETQMLEEKINRKNPQNILVKVILLVTASIIFYLAFVISNQDEKDYTSEITLAQSFTGGNDNWIPVFQKFDNRYEMALVPVGCFSMGTEDSGSNEFPISYQCIQVPFWIDRYEASLGLYETCVDVSVCQPLVRSQYATRDEQPVLTATWEQANTFCRWRNAHLPSELEWEYSARGMDSVLYPWGNTFVPEYVTNHLRGNSELDDVDDNIRGQSWVGVLNMSGNAWEWTSSLYENYPYSSSYEAEASIISERVVRGGSFASDISYLRTSSRLGSVMSARFGFRCVKSME